VQCLPHQGDGLPHGRVVSCHHAQLWLENGYRMQDDGPVGVPVDAQQGKWGWLGGDQGGAFMEGEGGSVKQGSVGVLHVFSFFGMVLDVVKGAGGDEVSIVQG